MTHKIFSSLALALTLSATAHAAAPEALLGFQSVADGLSFQVLSTGCTQKEQFEVRLSETDPARLRLVRTTPDLCEVAPHAVPIKYTWKELGLGSGQRFQIINPIATLRVPESHF